MRGAALALAVGVALLLAACSADTPAGAPASPSPTRAKHASAKPKATKKPTARPSSKPSTKPSGGSASSTGAGVTKIVFVDVGQGDGIIVRNGSWTGLIDGGPSEAAGAVETQLSRLGVSRLDMVVASHPDADHIGDLAAVIRRYRPGQVVTDEGSSTWTYGQFVAAIHAVGARTVSVREGATLRFGRLPVKVLAPSHLVGDTNEDSIVLLLDPGGREVLLTGDSSGPEETLVGGELARAPPLYLLKVAHHGSAYATSSWFLREARPRYAVISVGPNSYGHPTQATIGRLRATGATIYDTWKNGTVTLTITAGGHVTWSFSRSGAQVTSRANAVVGAGGGGGSGGSAPGGTIVYITATGECYHRAGCRYLSQSKIAVTLAQAKAQGYRPCSVCKPPQ